MSRIDVSGQPTRRQVLRQALFVSFAMSPAARALAQTVLADEGKAITVSRENAELPGDLKTTPWLDAWIRVDADNRVTVFTGKVELGTGIRTALLQVAAEELCMVPALIRFVTADTGQSPDEGLTAGSHTMADSGTALLHAAAQVRGLLTEAAARRWRVEAKRLTVRDALITAPDGRRARFADLIGAAPLHRRAALRSPLKPPQDYSVLGSSLARADLPAKVTGGAAYVQDLRLPGMLHARVVLPPVYGAELESVDTKAVERLPGVVRVVRDGQLLAVLAQGEWQAVQAQRALEAAARWRGGRTLPDPAKVHAELKTLSTQSIEIARPQVAAGKTRHLVQARFRKNYLMHGSIGPSCAVAHQVDGRLTVWTHSQGVYPLRDALAEMLAMPKEMLRCIHVEGSGCYGHNGADDAAAFAAYLARLLAGRPVRLMYTREQEHLWDHYTPAMVTEVSAGVDAQGRIVRWDYELWSSSHNQRIVNAGRLVPATLLAKPFVPAPSTPMVQPEGGGDRNGIPIYALPHQHIVSHFSPTMPLETSAMRSLGAHTNVWSIESVMDELALAAGVDPVEFRLRHLQDERMQAVVRETARAFGWPRPARQRNRGVGFACARYKNLMAYMAIAVEIRVQPETGELMLERAEVVVDAGQAVNPDGIRNQIEGGVIQAASWTLYEELRYDTRRIRSFDWSSYPILRFADVPGRLNVQIINRPGAPFLGVAEAAMGPTAGALANALFDATGVRARELPMAGERLRRALLG
ncbi:MAG: aldehyde dehydrogenase [Roseateles depolymerans]|uniref:Aldehyde dehydrogenase n=1 Tax=Roseateles depolymerans TaxID=76731 RepID=A0A2W5DVJ4_9BURK|nr:MAG: aldehyde dehydrogenase [Roseateles depolymerans]